VRRNAGSIDLSFVVNGQIAKIALPGRRDASRADELWQHTCFELFARSQGAHSYSEFNFSPSTQWAAYRFSAYREGMMHREVRRAPTVQLATSDERFQFDVQLDARDLPTPPTELALTAVIEESSGIKSYWALHHRPDKPDFHYEHGFVLSLD
jgi:hypothetical protein